LALKLPSFGKGNAGGVDDDFDDDDFAAPSGGGSGVNLPWILLAAGWGGSFLAISGLVLYLWLASDSIMDEVKAQRPQVTIKVVPKRRPAQAAKRTPPPKSDAAPKSDTAAKTDADADSDAATTGGESGEGETAGTAAGADTPEKSDAAGKADPAAAEKAATLHPHPDPELIEETEQGLLPKVDGAGRQPWRVYSRPFNALDKRKRIAVVMLQMGLSPKQTQNAINDLPGAVTLGFAPYARGLEDWIKQARDSGHEVLIGLPMEPREYPSNDPGPNGLLTRNTVEENVKRLNWTLSRVTGYVGVFNLMGAKFTANRKALTPVFKQLGARGLLMLDTRASAFTLSGAVAQEVGLPFALMDSSPDSEPNRGAIDRELAKVIETAEKKGRAVAILKPYPITLLRLKRWIKRLDAKKLILAPLSAVVVRPKPKG